MQQMRTHDKMTDLNTPQLGQVFSSQNKEQSPSDGVVKWRMDTEKDIIDMENRLMGYIYDPKLKRYVSGGDDSLKICDRKGVSAARIYISAAINKSSIQANLTDEQFNNFMESLIDGITKDVGLNYKEYGIESHHREIFVENIVRMVFLVLSRSIGDKERHYSVRQGKETFVQKYALNPVRDTIGKINL